LSWTIYQHPLFLDELKQFDDEIKRELFAKLRLLEEFGPSLARPHADTLEGSQYANMKELRFNASNGVWRIAFAFDPEREAILLVGGDKSGKSQKRFYKSLISKADKRFSEHLSSLQ